jgi:hypothetical protein
LEAACQKRPLEKKYLTVKRVPISTCIHVSGFKADTSENTLEYYFDNEKRSGGGGVTDIKVSHDDDWCLVYFEDHTSKKKMFYASYLEMIYSRYTADHSIVRIYFFYLRKGLPCMIYTSDIILPLVNL